MIMTVGEVRYTGKFGHKPSECHLPWLKFFTFILYEQVNISGDWYRVNWLYSGRENGIYLF